MPLSVSANVRQLSDGNTDGTILGRGPSDVIGFYGLSQGVVQPSGAAEAAMTRGIGSGVIAVMATSQTPTAIGAATTSQSVINGYVTTQALTGFAASTNNISFVMSTTGDLLYVNKPTQQAGLGYGNAYVSGTNAASVNFSNWSAATVTPTAAEKYGIVALRGFPFLTASLSPAAVSPQTTAEQLFTVTGARFGEVLQVSKPTQQVGLDIVGMRVAANNQVGITFGNLTAATITPTAAQTYTFFSVGGIDSPANVVEAITTWAAPVGPASSTVTGSSFSTTGVLATDTVIGLSKPTTQAGMAFATPFVSAANTVGLSLVNITATVTPTSYEAYGLSLYRLAPVAPCVVYQQAISPAAVGPNTTVSQLVTITGVVASSMVWVNKPAAQTGLGICGVRATSNAGQIEITYGNATAATITPTQNEVYLVANYQQAVPDLGNAFIFTFNAQEYQNTILSNAMRSALTSVNLIAGA